MKTFNSYVIGPNNILAFTAAKQVAENPGVKINPLILYGNTGLGKMHLSLAIESMMRENSPTVNTALITGEGFFLEYNDAVKNGTMKAFDQTYNGMDYLAVTDYHYIEQKEMSFRKLYEIINHLCEKHKQVVFTSQIDHEKMLTINLLRDTFEHCLIVKVNRPDIITKAKIIRNIAEKININIEEGAVIYLARMTKANVRSIENTMLRIELESKNLDVPITKEYVQVLLMKWGYI